MAAVRRRETGGGELRRAIAVGLACLLLTAFFFVVRFPYDVFRGTLVRQLAAVTGAELQVGSLSGRLSLGGLALAAEPVTLRWPAGTQIELTRAALRPAWSPSWLRGRPALYVNLEAPAGNVAGTVWPGARIAFDGNVRELALEKLPPEVLAAAGGFALTGRLDAEVDVSYGGELPVGDVTLDLRDGAFSAPGLPISIPFERAELELGLREGGGVEISSAALRGPMVQGSAQGTIGATADPILDLQIALDVPDPSLRGIISPLGIRLDSEGKAKVRVTGTPSNPILQ